MQSVMHARRSVCVCVWLDRHNQNKEARHREGPELSTDDLTNMTHRKDPTASGDRMRDNKDSKTNAQVSQETVFSAEVGKDQCFVTRLSFKNERRWTLVCRERTPPRMNPNSDLVCSLCDNERISLGYKDNEIVRIVLY